MKLEMGTVESVVGSMAMMNLPGKTYPQRVPVTGKVERGDLVPVSYIHGDRQQPIGIAPKNRVRQRRQRESIIYLWSQYFASSFLSCLGTTTAALALSAITDITPPMTYPERWYTGSLSSVVFACGQPSTATLGGMRTAKTGNTVYGYTYDGYNVYCSNPATGEIVWTHRIDFAHLPAVIAFTGDYLMNRADPGRHICLANGKIYVLVDLISYNRENHVPLDEYDLNYFPTAGEPYYAAPATAGSYLYCITLAGEYDSVTLIRQECVGGAREWGTWSLAYPGGLKEDWFEYYEGVRYIAYRWYHQNDGTVWGGDPRLGPLTVSTEEAYQAFIAVSGAADESETIPDIPAHFETDFSSQYYEVTTSTYGPLVAHGTTILVQRHGTAVTGDIPHLLIPQDSSTPDNSDYTDYEAERDSLTGVRIHVVNLLTGAVTTTDITVRGTGSYNPTAAPEVAPCYLASSGKWAVIEPDVPYGAEAWEVNAGELAIYNADFSVRETVLNLDNRYYKQVMAAYASGGVDYLVIGGIYDYGEWDGEERVGTLNMPGNTIYNCSTGEVIAEFFADSSAFVTAQGGIDHGAQCSSIAAAIIEGKPVINFGWVWVYGASSYFALHEIVDGAISWVIGGATSRTDAVRYRIARDSSLVYLRYDSGVKSYDSAGTRIGNYSATLTGWSNEIVTGENFAAISDSDTIRILS